MFNDEKRILIKKSEEIEQKLAPFFKGIEKIAFYNQRKVLAAFKKIR